MILNGDDFGWSADTVEATIELLERGVLSSATIMPRMPSTGAAIEFARRTPKCGFGVHQTFGGSGPERPLTAPDRSSTLTAAEGAFRDSNAIRKDALLGLLSADQIAAEMEAQMRSVGNRGVAVSHVDSHGHVHKFSPFQKTLRDVLPRVGISSVRNVQDIYLKKTFRSPTFCAASPVYCAMPTPW